MQFLQIIDRLSRLLVRITDSGDHRSVKQLHAHLLRSNSLSLSIHLQSDLIFAYKATSIKFHTNPSQSLSNLLNFISPHQPLAFSILLKQFFLNGFHDSALETLSYMHGLGFYLNSYALCYGLTSCSILDEIRFGEQIYGYVVKSGWSASVFVGSAAVQVYVRGFRFDGAEKVLDEMPEVNSVCANALISGYCQAKMWSKGIELFRKMIELGLDYDSYMLTAVLQTCAGLSAIGFGRQVHGYILRSCMDLKSDVFLRSSLVEMYGKCGLVMQAWRVFDLGWLQGGRSQKRDIVLWTSILGAYGRNGFYMDVIRLYKEMLSEGIEPDDVSFVTVISACTHTGQVRLGLEFFESMVSEFGLSPGPEHYSCVVDLLCRAGELEKAWKMVNGLSVKEQDAALWGSLLGACKDCGNVRLGRLAADKALELDPCNAGIYMLMASLYARFGMRDEIQQLGELMKARGLKKDLGCSTLS